MATDVLSESDLRVKGKDIKALFHEANHHEANASLDLAAAGRHDELLEGLFATAEHRNLPSSHRAAACNTLCAYLEQGFTSPVEHVRKFYHDLAPWNRLLGIYLERIKDPSSKPMKQILETLGKGLTVPLSDPPQDQEKTQAALARCVEYILSQDELSRVKPAMHVLNFLLSKGLVSALQLLTATEAANSHRYAGEETQKLDTIVQVLKANVLRWAQFVDIAPIAGKLLLAILRSVKLPPSDTSRSALLDQGSPVWGEMLLKYAEDEPHKLEIVERYLLPSLLQASEEDSLNFLRSLSYDELVKGSSCTVSEKGARFCLLTVKTILQSRLTVPSIMMSNADNFENSLLPYEALAVNLLSHSSFTVRTTAFGLLIFARSPNNPFSENVLASLAQALPLLCSEPAARARVEFLSAFKELCARLWGAIQSCRKFLSNGEHGGGSEARSSRKGIDWAHTLDLHVSFGSRCLQTLLRELDPSRSYQRHVLALRCLKIALTHDLPKATEFDFYTIETAEILLDLVLDAYDDVRSLAASLLQSFEPPKVRYGQLEKSMSWPAKIQVLERAQYLAKETGRASLGDGLGRLYELRFAHAWPFDIDHADRYTQLEQLIQLLEKDIGKAEKDLTLAVASVAIPAHFIALRYLASRSDFGLAFSGSPEKSSYLWQQLHCRLIHCVWRTWEVVKGVLCIDSPEGQHEEFDEPDEDGLPDIGLKDTLSYCWRSLKESSSLMYAMLANESYSLVDGEMRLAFDDFKAIGDLSFLQLNELRHRGAFSTVSLTFLTCCSNCVRSGDKNSAELPVTWFQGIMQSIFDQATALTRRSAGIPSTVVGILTAYPPGRFFDQAITQLLDIAKAPVGPQLPDGSLELPQVHALNCLKDVFSSSRLSDRTEASVEKTLDVAVECLVSDIWAIRNCGVMLFRALLTRLCGGTNLSHERAIESRRRFAKSTHNRYPKLAENTVRLLQLSIAHDKSSNPGDNSRKIQVAFPALEIIEKVGIPARYATPIQDLLFAQLVNESWRMREKAARSLSLMLEPQVLLDHPYATGEAPLAPSRSADNALHGVLLCFQLICERCESNPAYTDVVKSFYRLQPLLQASLCPLVMSKYWDICTSLMESLLNSGDIHSDSHLLEYLDRLFLSNDYPAPTRTSHYAAIESYVRAKMTWSCIRASRDQSCKPILAALLHAIDVWPSAIGIVLRSVKSFPCPLDAEQLLFLVQTLYDVLGSPVPCATSSWADFLAMTISHFQSGPLPHAQEAAQYKLFDFVVEIFESTLMKGDSDPTTYDSTLRLRGSLIALIDRLVEPTYAAGSLPEVWMKQWAAMLKLALSHESDLSQRFAAVQSLHNARSWLRDAVRRPIPGAAVGLLALYEALNDDDDEVRDIAAQVQTVIFHAQGENGVEVEIKSHVMPAAAVERLLSHFEKAVSVEPSLLINESISRIIGPKPPDLLAGASNSSTLHGDSGQNPEASPSLVPAREALARALVQDTALFVEEKQNLHVDPVQEAERWSRVLLARLVPQEHSRTAMMLRGWATDGLAALVETAEVRTGGPLGWTSQLDVFVLGMRVLIMADVVMQCKAAIAQSSEKEADAGDAMLNLLQRLRELGPEKRLHRSWRLRLDAILEKISERGT